MCVVRVCVGTLLLTYFCVFLLTYIHSQYTQAEHRLCVHRLRGMRSSPSTSTFGRPWRD